MHVILSGTVWLFASLLPCKRTINVTLNNGTSKVPEIKKNFAVYWKKIFRNISIWLSTVLENFRDFGTETYEFLCNVRIHDSLIFSPSVIFLWLLKGFAFWIRLLHSFPSNFPTTIKRKKISFQISRILT